MRYDYSYEAPFLKRRCFYVFEGDIERYYCLKEEADCLTESRFRFDEIFKFSPEAFCQVHLQYLLVEFDLDVRFLDQHDEIVTCHKGLVDVSIVLVEI